MNESKLIINGIEPIFHVVMAAGDFGLSDYEAERQDMAEEYMIEANPKANGGIVIYGKYRGEWVVNPYSTRFLVCALLKKLDVKFQ